MAPDILMQHLGAGGQEDALWIKLYGYLDGRNLPKCFLTNKGDADVIWEVREWRLQWVQNQMRDLLIETAQHYRGGPWQLQISSFQYRL